MAHREGIREFLKDVMVYGLVIDWGCGTKPIKKYLKPNKARFIGIDKLDHVGADVVADIEKPLIADRANYAFCLEVLEHCWDSKTVVKNIYDNLKNGGVLYLSQPLIYEVHKEDDRVRFTHHGLEQLLSETGFKEVEIHATVGDLDHAEGYIVKAIK